MHTPSKNWSACFQSIEYDEKQPDGSTVKKVRYAWAISGSAYPGAGNEKYVQQLTRIMPYDAARDAATIAAVEAELSKE